MKKINPKTLSYLIAVLFLALALCFLYLIVRISYFITSDYFWYEKALGFFLLMAEVFGLVHSIGYFSNVLVDITRTKDNIVQHEVPPLTQFPPVAILIPSYKEPLDMLEDTLLCIYNLTYPNKQLYFLDDTRYDKPWTTPEKVQEYRAGVEALCKKIGVNLFRRPWRGAKAGIINDFLHYKSGDPLAGVEYTTYQEDMGNELFKYLIVFDSDVNPFPDFAETLVAFLENTPNAAFIQTPQYYSNFSFNRVARAAGLQQIIFFEYICESKGIQNTMFCCGSNVLINREALLSVGGFDESSLTEDFATSLKMHILGWNTLYYNKICAFGMGPEDLGGFFKQQFRWSTGTLEVLRRLPMLIIRNIRECSFVTWWSYFLSSSHFLIGWVFFVMLIFPVIYLMWDVPSYFLDPTLYIAVFFPYILISLFVSFWTLSLRDFKPSYLLQSILISAISFPIYMKASIYAFLGIRSTFGVTPKGVGSVLPLTFFWPQLGAMLLCVIAIVWGIDRIYYERDPVWGLVGNMVWCLYNIAVLSSLFYFNTPEETPEVVLEPVVVS